MDRRVRHLVDSPSRLRHGQPMGNVLVPIVGDVDDVVIRTVFRLKVRKTRDPCTAFKRDRTHGKHEERVVAKIGYKYQTYHGVGPSPKLRLR